MKLTVSALTVCCSLFIACTAQAKFGVQLPFLDGHAYRCMQNSEDTPTHKSIDLYTRYDLDFGMRENTLLVASAGGIVEKVENKCVVGRDCGNRNTTDKKCFCGNKGFGNHIKIKHDSTHSTLYAHLKYKGVLVEVGDEVIAGQPIGFSGNTGRSGGPHLHYGMHEPSKKHIGKSIKDIEIVSHDKNTGEDLWRLVGVPRNDSKAFRCYIDGNDTGHKYEAMDMNGGFSSFQCAKLNNGDAHCWRGEMGNDGKYHMGWCDEAYYHIRYYTNGNSQELSSQDGWDLCNQHSGDVELLTYLHSDDFGVGGLGGGGGSGTSDDDNNYNEEEDNTPDDNSHDNGSSDLSISNCYLSIYGDDDWKHKITRTLNPGESFQINAEGRVRNGN